MDDSFNTLEEYAKTIKLCLENVVHDYQMAENERPIVTYATAPIAYAKMQEHFANGSNVGPLITFYQSGITFPKEAMMGMFKILPVQSDDGNFTQRAPMIAELKYKVTIDALTEAEADMLEAQILAATPEQRPYYTFLNDQWVLIRSGDPVNLSTVEAGDNKDKVSRREIELTIERAYIMYTSKELNAGYINEESGEIVRNPSEGLEGAFNYNVKDKDGNIVGTKQVGKVNLESYIIDKLNNIL